MLCKQFILVQNFRNAICIVIDPLSKVLGREDLKATYDLTNLHRNKEISVKFE